MKSKVLVAALALAITIPLNVFAGNEKTEEGKIIGPKLRDIRKATALKVCDVFEYNNSVVIKLINDGDWSFSDSLKLYSQTDDVAKKVKYVIGTFPGIDGDDLSKADQTINGYLNTVSKRCNEKGGDTTWVKVYRSDIKKIIDDYTCYFVCKEKGRFFDYREKYGGRGLLQQFVPEQDSVIEEVESQINSEETEPEKVEKNEKPKKIEKEESHIIPIIVIVVILLGGGYAFYRIKRSKAIRSHEKTNPQKPSPQTILTTVLPKDSSKNPIEKELDEKEKPTKPSSGTNTDNGEKSEPIVSTVVKDWIVVGASVKGNGHIQNNIPCQDNHKFESIGEGWGIAIVSDGAGSAAHSELGSKVVVERGMVHLKNLLEKEGWMKNSVLPSDVEWLQKSYYVLKAIRDDVEMLSKKKNVELKSLSATCLAVVYSPLGLLAAHVGDGRMGYKSTSGEWRAMMTPHKGDEANQTIFLVSDFWSIPNYVMSGVLVPESIVVREPVKAFALMSDGCENTAWKCTALNPDTGKYYDQNKPFEGFFNPLEETLLSLDSEEERQAKWYKFIESGATGFVKEQDDKTMVYGVFVNN